MPGALPVAIWTGVLLVLAGVRLRLAGGAAVLPLRQQPAVLADLLLPLGIAQGDLPGPGGVVAGVGPDAGGDFAGVCPAPAS